MTDTINDLTNLQLVLLIVAAVAGLYQVTLLITLVVHDGTVTAWFGVISAACLIGLVMTR